MGADSSDRATGTEAYLTDTLTVNVTGYDKTTNNVFDLGELPTTTSVEKLYINNGAASVTGSINGDFQYINVKGTGSFTITNATTSNDKGFKDIVLNSGATKEGDTPNEFTTADNVGSIKTGAGDDVLNLGTVTKSIATGAGKDDVTASLDAKATADLGAGNDVFKGSLGKASSLYGGAGDDVLTITGKVDARTNAKTKAAIAEIEIDGGTGADKVDLSGVANNNALGIKSIKGVEALAVGKGTTLYASAISGQKMTLEGDSLVLNAAAASTVDLSKMTNADGADVAVKINNVKSGNVSLAYGNKDFNNLKETIVLAKDASKVTIKGFEQGDDKIEIAGTKVSDNANAFFNRNASDEAISIDTTVVEADNIYFVNLKDKISKAEINKLLDNANKATFTKLGAKDVFYIVATDSAVGGDGKNSTAKIYKVEVGKDQKVSKLDQISTTTVADKGVLDTRDFVEKSTTFAETIHPTVDPITNKAIADVSAMGDNVKIATTQKDGTSTPEVTIKGSSSTQNIIVDTATGKDTTINVGDTRKGTDQIKSIETGAGDDTIVFKNQQLNDGTPGNNVQITLIDGGEGKNTLKLDPKVTLQDVAEIKNIDTIDISEGSGDGGLISAKALNNSATAVNIKTDGKILTLWGDSTLTKELDLTKLKSDGGSNDYVRLDSLDNTRTIKLSADDGIIETIKLDDFSGSWTVSGLKVDEDKVEFANAAVTAKDATAVTDVGAATSGDVTANGVLELTNANGAVTVSIDLAQKALSQFGVYTNKAVIYKASDNNTYLINTGATTNVTDDAVINLGTIDVAKITADTNTISFA